MWSENLYQMLSLFFKALWFIFQSDIQESYSNLLSHYCMKVLIYYEDIIYISFKLTSRKVIPIYSPFIVWKFSYTMKILFIFLSYLKENIFLN